MVRLENLTFSKTIQNVNQATKFIVIAVEMEIIADDKKDGWVNFDCN
jgi:hypothetical protein